MGHPGDAWPPTHGEWPQAASGPYGAADPYRPGGPGAPVHDPHRGYPPLNDPDPSASGAPYGAHYGEGPGYNSIPQPPYAAPSGPQGPYGAPQPPSARPPSPPGAGPVYGETAYDGRTYGEPPSFTGPAYGEQSGYGYAPSGPQPGAPSGRQQPIGAGPGGPAGPGFGGPPPSSAGGNRLPFIIGGIVGAVVLLGGGGTALAFALKPGGAPAPQPKHAQAQPTRSSARPSPTASATDATPSSATRWRKLASRSTDPRPLTLREVFGHARLTAHRHRYRLAGRRQTTSCASAVTGTTLQAALTTGHCTQLLRATYLRDDGRIMGTVGIGNLDDIADVRRAFSAAAGGGQYVTPLRGSGRTATLGNGAALGIRQVKGHYLVLSWVQYADGHKPTSSGRRQLAAFHNDVVSVALARPLAFRMQTGRPPK